MVKLGVAFILMNALDIALTLYLVGQRGFVELNPVMRCVLTLSLPLALLYKVLVPALFVVILIILSRASILSRVHWYWIFAALVVGEAAVNVSNLAGLLWW